MPDPNDQTLSDLTPHTKDPGGAHGKGYGADADAGPTPPVPDNDPIPLADDARGHVRRRDEDAVLPPTGRDDAKQPGERVLGEGG